MPETLKRKPRNQPINPPRPAKQQKSLDAPAPATSAKKPTTTSRTHLTLSDWLSVYSFVDTHPDATQSDVVRHFTTLKTGALIFNQATLSRKLRDRAKMEARINDNPMALSSKRPRIVTPALKLITEAEDGANKQIFQALDELRNAAVSRSGLKIKIPVKTPTAQPELSQSAIVEAELEEQLHTLKARNRIFGDILTVGEILDRVEERQMGEGSELDGSVKGIADQVREIFSDERDNEVESEDDADDDGPSISRAELISLCQQLEGACMQFGDPQFSLMLTNQLHKYRAMLRREEMLNCTQTTLDTFVTKAKN